MQMFKDRYIKHFSNKEWKELIEKHRQNFQRLLGGKTKKIKKLKKEIKRLKKEIKLKKDNIII